MHGQGHGKVALALCFIGISQSGCDIVQGFRDASAAVFPDEKTYFDAPGFRLVPGAYRKLEFASGSSLYMLARSSDPENHSLYAMRYADPRPCALPNIGEHQPGAGVFKEATTIAYTEEGTRGGTLRFADGNCKTFDLTVKESGLPLAESASGFLVYENGDLILANPVSGMTRLVALEGTYVGYFAGYYVIFSKGRIGAFDGEWKNIAWFGDGVTAVGNVGNSFYYEDAKGIHRLSATGGDPPVADTIIAAGGCKLGFPRVLGGTEGWASYYLPCESKKLLVYAENTAHVSDLGIATQPGTIAFLPAHPSQGGDPALDPFYVFFLSDYDDTDKVGTLRMRSPDLQTRTLGLRTAFERLIAYPSASETHGFVLADVKDRAGTYLRWESDGSTRKIAESVFRDNGDLVVDFDGEVGKFSLFTSDGLSVVSKRVPGHGFRMRDPKNRWTAVLDDYDAPFGTISITESTLDFNEAALTPGGPPKLEPIARSALWDYRTQFMLALPGIAYFSSYEKERDIGRLEYRNLELRFTAVVSDGVSDYVATPDNIIYTVPFGAGAGIWVVRSR